MKQELEKVIHDVVKFFNVIECGLTRPDPQFGDWATNVALQLQNAWQESARYCFVSGAVGGEAVDKPKLPALVYKHQRKLAVRHAALGV